MRVFIIFLTLTSLMSYLWVKSRVDHKISSEYVLHKTPPVLPKNTICHRINKLTGVINIIEITYPRWKYHNLKYHDSITGNIVHIYECNWNLGLRPKF